MNSTPRLRSAYPSTPQPAKRTTRDAAFSGSPTKSMATVAPGDRRFVAPAENLSPVIPLDIVDAPTQRFYVLSAYILLNAWRLYDYSKLVSDDADSFWLFLKWGAIDGVFVFGLPGMRIPWLEWSPATTALLFLLHAAIDALLMFRIPIPIETWLISLMKVLYDREPSISGRSVNSASIRQNSSLILGKQIIHILPEGSATLNLNQTPFCIGGGKNTVELPITINQTSPISIELLRIDLDTNSNETITIPAKSIRSMRKQSEKETPKYDNASPLTLQYPVKKTGLYRLLRVIDESKLDVRRRESTALVVDCPKAAIKTVDRHKCRGELSDLNLELEGTPPLKIKYSKVVNREDKAFSFQTVQPEHMSTSSGHDLALQKKDDISWARSQHISVPVNESLSVSGNWTLSIDEIHDAFGNVANYSSELGGLERPRSRNIHLEQVFLVHERPSVQLKGCDSQHPLKAARGQHANLPVTYGSLGKSRTPLGPYRLNYIFTAENDLTATGEHPVEAWLSPKEIFNPARGIDILDPGLYTLSSISTPYCTGEVLEPASCLLVNPPEPEMSLTSEPIVDRCAGNPIGLLVDLDFIGTPPFKLLYETVQRGSKEKRAEHISIDKLRGQIELRPGEAGHYTYTFKEVSDEVYKQHSIQPPLQLEQEVKPSASARFSSPKSPTLCIEDRMSFDADLRGESPWSLEYELIHGGRRKKYTMENIATEKKTIQTEPLLDGGDYRIALTSVTDRSGCKMFLQEEANFQVRRQRPKASFGSVENRRSMLTLEGKGADLPLRLSGEPPWTIKFRNLNATGESVVNEGLVTGSNDVLHVKEKGVYEILNVRDALCSGTIDPAANLFEVAWIPRPQVEISESATIKKIGDRYVKEDVCEGDEDSLDFKLSGSAPYNVNYEEWIREREGKPSYKKNSIDVGVGGGSIRMDTTEAGKHEYIFTHVADQFYDHKSSGHGQILVEQHVNARPSAEFDRPGQVYRSCREVEVDPIPIKLYGQAPFYLEVEIKSHGIANPDVITIRNIESTTYDLRIAPGRLGLGFHIVTIRHVGDGRGCARKLDSTQSVQVSVSDKPTIIPSESRTDYCVGDHITYSLSGTPPFEIVYTFNSVERRAVEKTTTFKRLAELAGGVTITNVKDAASECAAKLNITKHIHQLPSVKISKGKETVVDIHEGGQAELLFEFWGEPPFHFTYTRSTNAKKGKKSQVLETKHETSEYHTKAITASDEGTYEVISIRDRYCSFTKQRGEIPQQKLLV